MIFWIFVILIVMGIAVAIVTTVLSNKHYHSNKNNSKIIRFFNWNKVTILVVSGIIVSISALASVIMLITIIDVQVSADGNRASNEQRYVALVYKAQTESTRDEFGIVNKKCIDEVQAWNEDVAKYQKYSDNFWIGIFYPKRAYEGLETIDLEDIKMRN